MERESESMLSAARKDATANQVLSELAENLSGIEVRRNRNNWPRRCRRPN